MSAQTLEVNRWLDFTYSEVFEIERGHYNKRPEVVGDLKFISASIKNNGVTDKVNGQIVEKKFPGNCITVVNNGHAGEAFYQMDEFTCSHDVNILRPRGVKLNKSIAMFLLPIISKEKFRFNYGRKWRYARMSKTFIRLPVNSSGRPDWKFMEKYVDSLVEKSKLRDKLSVGKNLSKSKLNLGAQNWKEFKYSELFEIKKGERVVNEELETGTTPVIRPIESDNGVHSFSNLSPNHPGNTITVNYNGSVGEAFYQNVPYFALDDINVLYPKFTLTTSIAMFILGVIKKEKFRFSYGRKWHKERMEKSTIRLPVDKNGDPDWKFMSEYIKSIQPLTATTKKDD